MKKDCEAILCKHWEKGSEGTIELAKKVAEIADNDEGQFSTLYPDKMNLLEKKLRLFVKKSTELMK